MKPIEGLPIRRSNRSWLEGHHHYAWTEDKTSVQIDKEKHRVILKYQGYKSFEAIWRSRTIDIESGIIPALTTDSKICKVWKMSKRHKRTKCQNYKTRQAWNSWERTLWNQVLSGITWVSSGPTLFGVFVCQHVRDLLTSKNSSSWSKTTQNASQKRFPN